MGGGEGAELLHFLFCYAIGPVAVTADAGYVHSALATFKQKVLGLDDRAVGGASKQRFYSSLGDLFWCGDGSQTKCLRGDPKPFCRKRGEIADESVVIVSARVCDRIFGINAR